MNRVESAVVSGIALSLLITSLSDTVLLGAILGFISIVILTKLAGFKIHESVTVGGIAMLLSFIFITLGYADSLGATGGLLVMFTVIGYTMIGAFGGWLGSTLGGVRA